MSILSSTTFAPTVDGRAAAPGSAFVPVKGKTSSWICRQNLTDQLVPQGRLPVESWTAEGRVSVVKSGPHRSVLRVESPVGVLFIKKYVVAEWSGRLMHLLRSPAAVREWNSIDAVRRAGIATVEPLAVGTVRDGFWTSESWLVTREIPDVVPLDEFVKQNCGRHRFAASTRESLARQLGRLIGRTHAAGFVHSDLHAGNILVRSSDDALSVWLIDLHEIRRSRFPSVESAGCNLALFDHFFLGLATPSDRRRFFAAWWDEVKSLRGDRAEPNAESMACREIDAVCRASEAAAYAKRDRKWRRGNRRLIVADAKGIVCRGLAAVGKEALKAWRDAKDETASRPANERLGAKVVVRAFPPTGSTLDRLRARWTGGPARNSWEMGHALLRRGIAAVRPLACVDRAAVGGNSRVLLDIPTSSTIAEYLRTLPQSPDRSATSRGVAERAARLIRRLHEAGFIHESISLQALRLSNSPDCDVFIDGLEHIDHVGRVSYRDRVVQVALLARDLRSMSGCSLTDRMRFLRAYLTAEADRWGKPRFPRWERARLRTLWRDVATGCGGASPDASRSLDIKPVGSRQTPQSRAA